MSGLLQGQQILRSIKMESKKGSGIGTSLVSDASLVDTTSLNISGLKELNGRKMIYVNNQKGNKLVFQLTKLRTPFGLQRFKSDSNDTLSIDFSLAPGHSRKLDAFVEFVKKIEQRVKNNMTSKSEYRKDEVKSAFRSGVRKSITKKEYPPTFKLQIKENSVLYDVSKKHIQFNEKNIPKGTVFDVIFELSCVWIQDTKGLQIGTSYRVLQMRIRPIEKQVLKDYAFVNNDAEAFLDNISVSCDDWMNPSVDCYNDFDDGYLPYIPFTE